MNTYNGIMVLIDLLFPKFCLGCRLPGTYLCPHCQKNLRQLKQGRCFYCQRDSLYGLTHPLCLKKFNVDGVTSLYSYNGFLKKIIKNFKYRLATKIAQDLFRAITPEAIDRLSFYKKLSPPIYFQPIPLSRKKFRERGFNQAFILTKFFMTYLNLPIADFLLRVKDTDPQSVQKNKRDRSINLRNAFVINQKTNFGLINNARIILVDDVITSGSTIREAAKVLRKAGALKIYALSLAG